ncbi:hypothetical protein OSSY52_01630 [Tepiditoga spiralis]|uniref:GGDEF domain-containing protein n=1 Tax=Tepiditoga spiralis TaxID=2108365 RepID=A0A7G1G7N0_9BACT|nr:GGDEF domain-containing protein [Tepiditoga spiralis]BBE30022.1 hypothetical protein OSSY52_01630 [Tepiditoga spiralis]
MFLEKNLKKYEDKIRKIFIEPELNYIFSEMDKNIYYEFNTDIYIHENTEQVPLNIYKILKLAEHYNLFKIHNINIVKEKEKQSISIIRNNGNLITLNYTLMNTNFNNILLHIIKNSSNTFSSLLINIFLKSSRISHILLNSRVIIEESLKHGVGKEKIIYAILTGITTEFGAGFDRAILFKKYGSEYKVYRACGQKSFEENKKIKENYLNLNQTLKQFLNNFDKAKPFGSLEVILKNFTLKEEDIKYKYLFEDSLKQNNAVKLPISSLSKNLINNLDLMGEIAMIPLNFENSQYGFILCDNRYNNTPISDEQLYALDYLGKQGSIILETKISHEALKFEAETDSLTGLGNRNSYEKYIQRLSISGEKHIGIAMIDLDNFKIVNDTFGHKAGDELLIKFSKIIKEELRKTDYAFRYGGDEFTLFFKDIDSEMLKLKLQNIEKIYYEKTKKTFSAGGLIMKYDIYDEIKNVDELLYKSKNSGKGKISMRF